MDCMQSEVKREPCDVGDLSDRPSSPQECVKPFFIKKCKKKRRTRLVWSDAITSDLLKIYVEEQAKRNDKSVRRSDTSVWKDISGRLRELHPRFPTNFVACRDKFKNLRKSDRRIRLAWPDAIVTDLLRIYVEEQAKRTENAVQKSDNSVWKDISRRLLELHPTFQKSYMACRDKFKTLKNRYLVLKRRAARDGIARTEEDLSQILPHYKAIHQILQYDPLTELAMLNATSQDGKLDHETSVKYLPIIESAAFHETSATHRITEIQKPLAISQVSINQETSINLQTSAKLQTSANLKTSVNLQTLASDPHTSDGSSSTDSAGPSNISPKRSFALFERQKVEKGMLIEMQAQTALMKQHMEISLQNHQKIVEAINRQTACFESFIEFINLDLGAEPHS